MDTSSSRPQRRATIELWRIAVLVIGAFCFALLAIGRVPSRDTHEAILTALRAIDVNHASLQRDVLRARAGLLRNYDPLVESIVNLHAALSRLRATFPESGVENVSDLDRELTALAQSIDRDEALVERFKTDNAILQNSLTIANQLLSELHASTDPAIQQALGRSNDLGNMMMRFEADPGERLARSIQDQLGAILRSDAANVAEVRTYVAHARMILATLPAVDGTIASIQASQTPVEAQLLQKHYLDAFGVISVRSAWSRILLGSISVLLCIYVAILVYRLRSQTNRLTQQLDLENLIADIKQRFSDDFDSVANAVMDSLVIVAEFFDASRYAFVVVDTSSRSVVESFGNVEAPTLAGLTARFSDQISASTMAEKLHWDRFFYQNLQRSEMQALPEGSLSAGSVVATSIDAGKVGLLFLEHAEIRKKPGSDEIRLLGQAIVALSHSLRGKRERKERQELEGRLEHAQRLEAVGTLAGGIAHEFNNALSAIMGYGEMALELNQAPSRTRQYIQEIVSSGLRAKHVVDQILTFSRKRERVSRPFDVKEAIDDIVPLVKMSIPDTIQLSSTIAPNMPAVAGNPIELQQVIMNLCTNAAQAAGENGRIQISAQMAEFSTDIALSHGNITAGRYVLVGLTDNGTGIAPGLFPYIFEPFFTTRVNRGGTGLGLAAVHGLVTAMDGRIDVESRQGEGTTFNLYFPVSAEAPVPLEQFFNERTVPLGNGEMVLLGQRDHNLRLMYEEKIAALGYEPVGFESLSALKDWVSESARAPDLILLDLDLWQVMPDLRHIAGEFGQTTTVFIVEPEHAGADHRVFADISMLRKPISSNRLAATLFELIGNKQPRPEVPR